MSSMPMQVVQVPLKTKHPFVPLQVVQVPLKTKHPLVPLQVVQGGRVNNGRMILHSKLRHTLDVIR